MKKLLFLISIIIFAGACFKPSIPKKNSGYKGIDSTEVKKPLKKNNPVTVYDSASVKPAANITSVNDTVKTVQEKVYMFDLYSEDGVEYVKMAAPVFLEQVDNYLTVWEQNQVVNSHNLYEIKHRKESTFGTRPCIEIETLHAPNSYLPPNKAERVKFIFISDETGKIVFMRIGAESFASQLPNGVIPSATYVKTKSAEQSTRRVRVQSGWSITEVCGGVIFPNIIMTREQFDRLNPKYRYTDNLLRGTYITIPN